jgi:hypothetical protein
MHYNDEPGEVRFGDDIVQEHLVVITLFKGEAFAADSGRLGSVLIIQMLKYFSQSYHILHIWMNVKNTAYCVLIKLLGIVVDDVPKHLSVHLEGTYIVYAQT